MKRRARWLAETRNSAIFEGLIAADPLKTTALGVCLLLSFPEITYLQSGISQPVICRFAMSSFDDKCLWVIDRLEACPTRKQWDENESIRDNLAVYDSRFVLVISCACLG